MHNSETRPEPHVGLVGDYRFHRDEPWGNRAEGRLPAIHVGWGEPGGDGELAHGVGAAQRVPSPVLYGRIPHGGSGEGEANNWALAWTRLVRAYVPEHPDLNLGERFTMWARFYYAGTADEEQADAPVRLLSRWHSPPDRGYLWWCRPSGVVCFTAAFDDTTANWSGTAPSVRLDTVGWYDVAVVFDGTWLSLCTTPLGSQGPGPTGVQRFPREAGARPRFSVLSAAINEVAGDLRVMQYGAMLEHLLLYREQALDEGQIRGLSAGVCVPGACSAPGCAAAEVEVGTARQLFVDDAIIARREGLERRWHTARKDPGNPLLTARPSDHPECGGPSGQVSVLRDETEGCFRMWYHQHHRLRNELFVYHATSADGREWARHPAGDSPDSGVRMEGLRVETFANLKTVWQDLEETDPDRRFKAFAYPMEFYTSPDGLHWASRGEALFGADDASMGAWLPESRRHLFAIRPLMTGKPPGFRTMAIAISDSPLGNRMPMKLVFIPDKVDLAADPHLQFYHMPVYEYEGWCLSPLSVYHSDDASDGTFDVQWAFSRGGLDWWRPDERPLAIARGEFGEWDGGSIAAGSSLVDFGDELGLYYAGYSGRHHEVGTNAIGLATLRKDGFASLHAAGAGTLTTLPFRCDGARLALNAQAAGRVGVAVLDEERRPYEGLSLEDCEPFRGDAVSHTITWLSRRDLAELQGRTIRLQFDLQDADLYAFQIYS